MSQIRITATVGAYLMEQRDMQRLLDAMTDPEKHGAVVGYYLHYSPSDMSRIWTHMGDAEITVTMKARDEQVRAAVKTLSAQLEQARSDFMTRQQEILRQINELQALPNEVEVQS